MRVIVTRPRPDAERTAEALRARGHAPILSPVMEIAATGAALPPGPFDRLIVTSANALPPVTPAPAPALLSVPVEAVGAATAAAARAAGFADVRVGPGDGEALARALAAALPAGTRLLYLAGRERSPGLEAVLGDAGLAPSVAEVYGAVPARALSPPALAALGDAEPLAVLHFSARSAALFLDLVEDTGMATPVGLVHCCLSEAVARPLAARGLAARVATKPQADALMALLPR